MIINEGLNMEKLKLKTKDLTAENIAKLAILFPNLITEVEKDGKIIKTINASKLKEVVGDYATSDSEVYELTWVGKQESKQKITAPITKTLRPVPGDSVDFENTENLYIEGDNFEVLKVLQESYLNKVKMIYIDPPYNTGKDFVYKDNFSQSTAEYDKESGAVDEEGNKLTNSRNINKNTNPRFHSDWLSMIYERLVIAKDLLSDDGAIFISIGDDEVDNLKKIGNEIFGETNFISIYSRISKKGSSMGKFVSPAVDYIICYVKDAVYNEGFVFPQTDKYRSKFNKEDANGKYKTGGLYQSSLDPLRGCVNQRYYIECPDGTLVIPPGENFPKIKKDGERIAPESRKDKVWRWSQETYLKEKNNLIFSKSKNSPLVDSDGGKTEWNVLTKQYHKSQDESKVVPGNLIEDCLNSKASIELKELDIPFDFPKPSVLIKYLLEISRTSEDDTILDFFSGSATTAHAVMSLNADTGGNRKFILVQLPEETDKESEALKAGYKNICEIGKERIRRAAKKIIKEHENKQSKIEEEKMDISKLDFGFRVFRLDSSNMKDVYYNPDEIDQRTLTNFKDNIKEDRTDKDLLYQVLLDLAVPISAKVEEQKVKNKSIYRVNENYLIACFDEDIDLEIVKEIAKLNPLRLVFKDSSFKDDSTKVNTDEYLKHKLPGCIVRVI